MSAVHGARPVAADAADQTAATWHAALIFCESRRRFGDHQIIAGWIGHVEKRCPKRCGLLWCMSAETPSTTEMTSAPSLQILR